MDPEPFPDPDPDSFKRRKEKDGRYHNFFKCSLFILKKESIKKLTTAPFMATKMAVKYSNPADL
jgi:hypothetical protein